MQAENKKNIRTRMLGVVCGQAAASALASTKSASLEAGANQAENNNLPPQLQVHPSNTSIPSNEESTFTAATGLLQALSSRLIDLIADDSDVAGTPPSRGTKVTIQNFDDNHWVGLARRSAIGSLQNEMEYYDLLDLDAEGTRGFRL